MGRILDMSEIVQGGLGRTTEAYIEYLRLRALEMLEHRPFVWGHVEAVAAALQEHETLSGRRFRAVCQQAIDEELAPGRARLARVMSGS